MCVLCVPIDRTLVAWFYFSLSFFFFFSFFSCLRYVCATANSSLELNIQLVPLISRDPRNELCGWSTSIRIHACTFIFLFFFFFRTLHSAVLLILIMHVDWTPRTAESHFIVFIFYSVHLSLCITFAFGQFRLDVFFLFFFHSTISSREIFFSSQWRVVRTYAAYILYYE